MASSNPSTQDTPSYRNLVITGFMGTGKSTVGVLVAQKLGFAFVDTDTLIEAHAGMTISQIFAQEGETRFRALEREIAEALNHERGKVISTGGGMLVKPEMRELMMRHNLVVCLNATPEALKQRLVQAENRPLARDWERLLEQRRDAYAAIPQQCETTGRTPDEIAEEIVALWQNASK